MSDAAVMVSVFAGQRCIGFLLRRGREGIEALDSDGRSLGLYASPIEAAAAVERAAVLAKQP
jgi:hypothetical protein